MLYKELADKIVSEVRRLLDEDIIVVDTTGMIIASTDPKRVNSFHEGALIASQRKEKLIISEADQAILKGVKAGINLPIFFQGNVVGVIGITGTPEAISPFGEIIRKMTELLISETYYTEQFDWQSRSMEAFLLDWLYLKEWNENFLDRAHLLDIDMNINRQVMIAEVTQDPSFLHRDVWLSILSWQEKGHFEIISRWGNNRIIYLLTPQKQKQDYSREKAKRFHQFLVDCLHTDVFVGVGLAVSPLHIQNSYQQAIRALNACKTKREVVFDEDLALDMILDEISQQTRDDFVKRTIKALLTEEELILTLKKLIEHHFSLKNTAQALHIHINTLHYRLKKITDLTKLNPRNIDDLFVLYLALQFLENQS
ncbi:sugar diacid recognition domain-containing protein [Robertmurraya sp. FSL W8-0741]|uniref:CdaR family transcriptional regulator n=1 Tax=Robertmurraya sp. FSL W8-0741 TaxID=2954629 RepID=UPI0030F7B5A4